MSLPREHQSALERIAELEQPDVLLPYQARLVKAIDEHDVLLVEKGRRIGYTWGIAAPAVLTAGASRSDGGMDVLYISYNKDITREFIDTCAMWARVFLGVAAEVSEFLFEDQVNGDTRHIQAFRIDFGSGFEIVALCSRPRSLRGKQGFVIVDEAAFCDELGELLKAALALLMWGGKVAIVSTHDGADNPFNLLLEEVRAGKLPYATMRVTFGDALAEGLYKRICYVTGKTWSPEAEQAWEEKIRAYYGDDADEELDCIPRRSGGKYLSRVLLESRAVDVQILRWTADDAFVDLSDVDREKACNDWLEENIEPLLEGLPPGCRSYLGEDFARSGDLSVQWPLLVHSDLRRSTPFVIELRNIPHMEQVQIILYLCANLPRFCGAALDATGNGSFLAERVRQQYGPSMVSEVMLSENWYREHMPPMKAALEDGKLDLPRDADTVDDFRALEVVRGVPRVAVRSTKRGADGKKQQRHGDAAIACALAYFASETLDGGPIDDWSVGGTNIAAEAFGGPDNQRIDLW